MQSNPLVTALPTLIDPEFGIIKLVREVPGYAHSPKLFYYKAILGNLDPSKPVDQFPVTAGTALDRDRALQKAVGEAVEQYGAACVDPGRLRLSSIQELDAGTQYVDPGEFAVFSQWQYDQKDFPYRPISDQTKIMWHPARDLRSGEEKLVPASLVYTPYTPRYEEGEVAVLPSVSTGMASHVSFEQAAMNGILEVVERDCVTVTWQARLSRPRLKFESLKPEHQDLIGRFEKAGYSVQLVNISNETGIPAVLGVMKSMSTKEQGAPIVLAAASSMSASVAVSKCLEELALMERYVQRVVNRGDILDPEVGFDGITSFRDHVRLWAHPEMLSYADFLTSSTMEVDLDDVRLSQNEENSLESLVDIIGESGYNVLSVDITPPDLQSLGFFVVRSIIPGYQPLANGYKYRPLGGHRLWTLPSKLGFAALDQEAGDNEIPYPFA